VPHDFVFTAGRLWDEGENLGMLDVAAGRLGVPMRAAGPLAGPDGGQVLFDNIHCLGTLGEEDLCRWLSARPVFVCAALYEPFGLSVLEAASAGCALILSDIPTFRELWDEVAIFVDPRDDDGFARAIDNLACAASPIHYQADPEHTLLTNVVGTRNLLRLAEETGARLLLASTSEVYGDPEVHPQPEHYRGSVSCTGPRACYDEGKRAAETLAFDFQRLGRADVRVARLFNTYGPRMRPDDGRVVANFVCQALTGADITVYGDGRQTRSFCYVGDMVDGLMGLMESDVAGPVNLGNPHEVDVHELVERVLRLTGSASKMVHRPLPVDDPRRRRPDISRAKAVLGWEPRVSLEQGLEATIAWFAEKRGEVPAAAAGRSILPRQRPGRK
jgi:UDP-glucuronate decarboxylase